MAVLAGAVTVSQTAFTDLLAARSGRIVTAGIGIGHIQFRQHAEHVGGTHLTGNLFLQIQHLHIEVMLKRQLDALGEIHPLSLHHVPVFGQFEVLDRVFRTFFAILFRALAAARHHHTGNDTRTSQPEQHPIHFFHLHFP